MQQCKCGSYAINQALHGRDTTDLDLCDVCYWRKRANYINPEQKPRSPMQTQKIFYFDVETTGLNPLSNGIIQLAWIIEVDGIEKSRNNLFIAPFEHDTISDEALEVNGLSREEIISFMNPEDAFQHLEDSLSSYCDRFDKNDKYYPCAYNGDFDYQFLQQWYLKNKCEFFGSWFNHHLLDPLILVNYGVLKNYFSPPLINRKLKTVAEYFKIPIQAHDALSDITATKKIHKIFEQVYNHAIEF